MLHASRGLRSGLLCGDVGFEENLLRQFTGLRAECVARRPSAVARSHVGGLPPPSPPCLPPPAGRRYFSIGDYTAGRMPLAYVQLVQVRCFDEVGLVSSFHPSIQPRAPRPRASPPPLTLFLRRAPRSRSRSFAPARRRRRGEKNTHTS